MAPPKKGSGEYTCMQGLGYLLAAATLVVAIYIARPAPITTFSRVMAWKALGSQVDVTVTDGNGARVTAGVHVVDDDSSDGSGRPLVLLHGFPTSSFDYKDVWPALCHSARRRCIAMDFLGYGLSDKPAANYTVTMHAETVDAVLAAVLGKAHEPVDVMAHDVGVTVMQEELFRHKECQDTTKAGAAVCPFRSVAMLNGGIIPKLHRPELVQTLLANKFIGPWAQWLMIRPLFRRALCRVFGNHTQPSQVELDEDYAILVHNGGRGVNHRHLQYMAERRARAADWEGVLSRALPRLLLINGPADPVSGRHVAQYIATKVTGVDVRVLPDHVGHFPQREMPARVAAVYEKWIAGQQ